MIGVIYFTGINRGGRGKPIRLLTIAGVLAGLLHAAPAAGLEGMA